MKLGLLKGSKFFQSLEVRGSLFWIAAGVVLVGFIGILDYLNGREISIALFYLAPIVMITWFVNPWAGLAITFLSAFSWLVAVYTTGERYSHVSIYFWNVLIRVVFYAIVTYLVGALQSAHRAERLAARTDFLTGAVNARFFHELLQMEVQRIRRYPHPFTLVYFDIDNFKLVNDQLGHQAGDELLRFIAHQLKCQLRNTDIVARVGGDEFALLLPSTRQPEAQVVLTEVYTNLFELQRHNHWTVTFSIGAVTCLAAPHSAEQIIKMADELMYEVKNAGKNGMRFSTYWGG
jgi:diguanylate cyclase (GGDEF)-like protein